MNKFLLAALLCVPFFAQGAGPDPAVMVAKREADLVWKKNLNMPGLEEAVLYGDPTAPGLYIIRVRFPPGTMSSPHFHPDERQITVIKGTWWAGTGPKWNRETTIPYPPGSFAVHHASEAHYDGARNEEVIVQISGIGPTGTTRVDESGKPR
jgi:quercetin dioxygenase-like cupin family protein